jgi:hypothetical protein
MALAGGYLPIYPCHVAPRDLRSHPIGTGPFKFVEFKPNLDAVTTNGDYEVTFRMDHGNQKPGLLESGR